MLHHIAVLYTNSEKTIRNHKRFIFRHNIYRASFTTAKITNLKGSDFATFEIQGITSHHLFTQQVVTIDVQPVVLARIAFRNKERFATARPAGTFVFLLPVAYN